MFFYIKYISLPRAPDQASLIIAYDILKSMIRHTLLIHEKVSAYTKPWKLRKKADVRVRLHFEVPRTEAGKTKCPERVIFLSSANHKGWNIKLLEPKIG